MCTCVFFLFFFFAVNIHPLFWVYNNEEAFTEYSTIYYILYSTIDCSLEKKGYFFVGLSFFFFFFKVKFDRKLYYTCVFVWTYLP